MKMSEKLIGTKVRKLEWRKDSFVLVEWTRGNFLAGLDQDGKASALQFSPEEEWENHKTSLEEKLDTFIKAFKYALSINK